MKGKFVPACGIITAITGVTVAITSSRSQEWYNQVKSVLGIPWDKQVYYLSDPELKKWVFYQLPVKLREDIELLDTAENRDLIARDLTSRWSGHMVFLNPMPGPSWWHKIVKWIKQYLP